MDDMTCLCHCFRDMLSATACLGAMGVMGWCHSWVPCLGVTFIMAGDMLWISVVAGCHGCAL